MALKNKNTPVTMSAGITSILMVFVVLCFTTFGVLSYLSADADLKLSKKAAQNTVRFYAADCLAEEKLAVIHAAMKEAGDKDALKAVEDLSKTEDFSLLQNSNGTYQIQFTVPVSDTQWLEVAAALNFESRRYTVKQRRLVTAVDWEEDEITVWPG